MEKEEKSIPKYFINNIIKEAITREGIVIS